MQPDASNSPSSSSASPPAKPKSSPKRVIAIVVIAVVVVLAALGGFLWWKLGMGGGSEFADREKSQAAIPNPQFRIGDKPYLYACSILQREDIAATMPFGLSEDKTNESIALEQAAPYSPTISEKSELGVKSSTGVFKGVERISSCNFAARAGQQHNLSVDLTQSSRPDELKERFGFNAPEGIGTLPSFKDTSFIEKKVPSNPKVVNVVVLHDNLKFEINIDSPGVTHDNLGENLDKLVKKMIANAENAELAQRWLSFNAYNMVGGAPQIDTCQALDYKVINNALGAEVNFREVKGNYSLDVKANTAITACTLRFGFNEDESKRAPLLSGDSQSDTDQDAYPHVMQVSIRTYESAAVVPSVVEGIREAAKKAGDAGVSFEAGDTSVAAEVADEKRHAFWVAKGNYFISFEIDQSPATTLPYEPTTKPITGEQMKKIFEALRLPG